MRFWKQYADSIYTLIDEICDDICMVLPRLFWLVVLYTYSFESFNIPETDLTFEATPASYYLPQ